MQRLTQPDWQHVWTQDEMERELAPFKFNGTGWYVTSVDSGKRPPHDPIARDTLLVVNLGDGKFQVSCWNRHGIKEELTALLSMPNRTSEHGPQCPTPLECFGGQHVCHLRGDVKPVPHEVPPPLDKIMEANASKGIPVEHVEWALKVYKLTATHVRASPHAVLERVFPKGEDEARKFFTQTQNIWNMRVRGREAPAFDVILGIQDARKHKKKGSFREIAHALCLGQVEAVNPDPPTE